MLNIFYTFFKIIIINIMIKYYGFKDNWKLPFLLLKDDSY